MAHTDRNGRHTVRQLSEPLDCTTDFLYDTIRPILDTARRALRHLLRI